MARFKVIQPQVIGQQQTLTVTNLGEGQGKMVHRRSRASPRHPQKGRRVGGEKNSNISRIPLPKSVTSKTLVGPGTDLTQLPVPPLPARSPPHHPIPSKLNPAPTNGDFPENPVDLRHSVSSPESLSDREPSLSPSRPPSGGFGPCTTSWHQSRRGHHRKQLHSVSSYRNCGHGNLIAGKASVCGAVGTKRVSGQVGDEVSRSPPPQTSFSSSSFHPRAPGLPGNPHPPPLPANCLPLGFEDTVRLVASCTAAATAAAMSSRRVSSAFS